MCPGEEKKEGKNLHGRRAAGGVSMSLSSCNIHVGWSLGLVLLEAFTSASDGWMGMVSVTWVAIPN